MTNFTPRARSCSSLFGGENARDAGEVVGYGYVCPGGGVEKRLDGREAAVTEFEDKEAGGFEMRGGLSDEISIEFVTFFAAVESDFWFVVADFAHQRGGFAAADVRRVAGDEIEERRYTVQKIAFRETDTVCNVLARGVALGDG